MLRKIGLSRIFARASASGLQGHQSTGLWACWSRYGLVSFARRFVWRGAVSVDIAASVASRPIFALTPAYPGGVAHGWAGTAAELINADPTATVHRLAEQHRVLYGDDAPTAQTSAWTTELHWTTAALRSVEATADWGVILEYELPFEGGRRPDVL